MWTYVLRRILHSLPVYLSIIALMMGALRVEDPVMGFLGKNPNQDDYAAKQQALGLDRPFAVQYLRFLGEVVTLDFTVESWDKPGKQVGQLLRESVVPTLALTVPALVLTSLISILIGLLSAFYRGRLIDKTLMVAAVLGMSISFLVYIIFGQYYGAAATGGKFFAISGYDLSENQRNVVQSWAYYCLLPVIISVIVAMGYDTRYYRAVMVEESNRDYILTALAKGASKRKVIFVHMLKNAMISIITRIMITLPFLITGSILLERYFRIPGMGQQLITAITAKDFPVVQVFTAMFAALFILTNILTDVMYALVDPRVRLS
ncbi:MAG: ABC transporter permease [Planctomycetota bacterium]